MADDVNKSGKAVNGRIPKQLDEAINERNRRIDHEYLSNDDKYSSLVNGIELIEQEKRKIAGQIKGAANPADRTTFEAQLRETDLLQQDVEARMARIEMGNAGTQNNVLSDRIKTYTNDRNTRQRTTTMSGEQRYYRMANQSADLYAPTEVIEQRINSRIAKINELGAGLSESVINMGTDDVPDNVRGRAGEIGSLEDQVALDKRILKIQKRQGLSTEKRLNAANDTIEGVAGYLGADRLKKEVASGKYGSLEQETNKLAEMFDRLTQATERFETASENAKDEQGNLTEEYKKASAEMAKIQKDTEQQRKIVGEVQRQGGGGVNGGFNLSKDMGNVRSMLGNAQGIDVDDKIMEMRLKAQTGQTAVDQFNRVNAATNGDMRALLRESTSQDFVKSFSDDMRSKARRFAGYGVIAGAAETVGAGFDAATGEGRLSGVGAGIMGTLRSGAQAWRGLPQTARALEAYRAGEEFSGVGLEIQAQGLQAVYNQQMAAYGGTMGLGSSALAAESTLLDKQSLGNFAKLGLTPAQAANLTSMSTGALGGAEAATSVARRAGEVAQTRVMSAEQYISMSGQLAGAGGGTKDLEDIMMNAVAAGMDNAKNIQQMVSATVGLSNNMAKMGISGTTSAGNLLTSTMMSIGGDKNIAAMAAESMINRRASMDASGDINLGNVFEHAQLRKLDPSMSTPELMSLSTLTPQELQAIVDGGDNGGRDIAYKYGLEKVFDRGGVNAFKSASGIAAQATAMSMGISTYGGTGDLEKIGRGEVNELSSETRAMAKTAGLGYQGLGIIAGREVKGRVAPGKVGSTAQDFMAAGAGREVQTMSSVGDINETLKQLATTMQALSQYLSPEKAQENVTARMNDMKGAGSLTEAGKEFKGAAAEFSRGVEKMNAILKSADLSEHRTSFNLKESTTGNVIKRTS